MCWYEIDPETGELGQFVGEVTGNNPNSFYFDDSCVDSFREAAWRFNEYLAAQRRPNLDDLVAFAVDGQMPNSVQGLDGKSVKEAQSAFTEFWRSIDTEYQSAFKRPIKREEKYWIAIPELRRMAVSRENFYSGKQIVREEWLLHDFQLRFEGKQSWARLRVFHTGSADTLADGAVCAFGEEKWARIYLEEMHYVDLATLRSMPEYTDLVPNDLPADTNDSQQPFRYLGKW